MKRSAAILGPTPAFLRWAIHHHCPLREPTDRNLADATFRQLRSLQELSNAYSENRVIDGIAVHRDVTSADSLLGFPVDEITAAYGGLEFVQSSCGNCAANTSDSSGWAGCFGLVILHEGLIEAFESGLNQTLPNQLPQELESTSPRWFGLWTKPILSNETLSELVPVLRTNERIHSLADGMEQLCQAMERCVSEDLELHVGFHPAGFSDGHSWKLNPHCELCKFSVIKDKTTIDSFIGQRCPCCQKGIIQADKKKRKVLGIRPYMRLINIVGEEACADLYQRSLKRTNS